MKKIFALTVAACVAGSLNIASAQTVAFTSDLSVATDNTASVYAATYSSSEDKFLASAAGTTVRIYNGANGAYESDLDLTGTAPSGLGFFALAAGSDGSIFGFENNATTLWQWDNIADTTPAVAATGVAFARSGHVIETGNNTLVALTGAASDGDIEVYNTADDVTYALSDTIPGAAVASKSSFAVNSAVDAAWAVGDTGSAITKAVNTGAWAAEPLFVAASGAGSAALVYDNTNGVLIGLQGTTVTAYNADTGADIGNITVTEGLNSVPGYSGAVVVSTAGSGTVYFAGRGVTGTNCAMNVLSYVVTPASEDSWMLHTY